MNNRTAGRLIPVGAVIAFLYIGRHYLSDIARIANAHPVSILGIAAVHLVTLVMTGWTYKIGLAAVHQPLQLREGFAIATLGSYSNLIIPRAGIGFVATYLKRIRRVQLTDFGCIVLVSGLVFLAVCCAAASPAILLFPKLSGDLSPRGLALVFATLACLGLAATQFYQFRSCVAPVTTSVSLLQRIQTASQRLGTPRVILSLLVIHTTMLALRALRLQLAFWGLGFTPSFVSVLVASLLGDLAFLVSVTPTALGFREAAVAWTAEQIGVTTAQAISVTLFDRLIFSLTTVVAAQGVIAKLLTTKRAIPDKIDPSTPEAEPCETSYHEAST